MGLKLPCVLLLTAALLAGCAGAPSESGSQPAPDQSPPPPAQSAAASEPDAPSKPFLVDDPDSPYPMAVESWTLDMDGDGRQETAAVFLRVMASAEEKPMRVCLFRQGSDQLYHQSAILEGAGTSINSVAYEDLTGNGSREFIISGFRLVASDNGVVIAASYWGKFKTTFQMVMVCLMIADLEALQIPTMIVTWVAVILTVVSLVDYLVKNKDVMKDTK